MSQIATSERLAVALEAAGAPPSMIQRARAGYYDDFKSPLATPISQLVDEAQAIGLADIARRAQEGEFDAEGWEGDAWMASSEGRAALRKLIGE